jgi:uncharacterized protein (DUF488 family)
MVTVRTVGHGTLSAEEFTSLLDRGHVDRIVDVRFFPGSRHNPQFGGEEMERWAPTAGIGYVWMRNLGGRRRPIPGSKHVALRNDSFRAYADYMETPTFLAAIDDLVLIAESGSPTVMCSESLWWRCHRRLIADYLVLVREADVLHLMHDGRSIPHMPTDGVRVADNTLVYDVGVTARMFDT